MARPRWAALAVALAIFGIFWAFAGDGLQGYFAADEMMNLYAAWYPPISKILLTNERPLGALLYRGLFALFGLNPLPYRALFLAGMLFNLGLMYLFARRVSGSREIAALACLLGAYQAHMGDLYYTSSTIFDLLCFTFFYSALVYYLRLREHGGPARAVDTAILITLYICALLSKEMAVTLPFLILIYEWIDRGGRKSRAGTGFLWWSIPLTLLYIGWKTVGPGRMTANPDYSLNISSTAFFATWNHYFTDLFYGLIQFTNWKSAAVWIAGAAIALLSRRKDLRFAWCVMFFGALPFMFITPRGFFVLYLTLPGWYLFGAVLLSKLRELLTRPWPQKQFAVQVTVFVAVAIALIAAHRARKPIGYIPVMRTWEYTKPLLQQLAARYPTMPPKANILITEDPFPDDDYILDFMFALRYRDPDLHLYRLKRKQDFPQRYDHVFRIDGTRLDEVAAPR